MHKILIFILVSIAFSCSSQQSISTVKGKVLDEQNNPIAGASIAQKGTSNGSVTDLNGLFTLNLLPDKKQIIEVSFIGFETQTVKVKSAELLITLVQDNAVLEEVVIADFIRTKRKKILSSGNVMYESEAKSGYAPIPAIHGPQESEEYDHQTENGFKMTTSQPLTTFAADVDRAGYSNVRRFLNNGSIPPTDAVRVEEMINYFDYNYKTPTGEHPIAMHTTLTASPFNKEHQLLRVALQTEKIDTEDLPASNLVFLIDVSGSMGSPNKLGLLTKGFKLLVSQLRPEDRVAIVTYAGSTRVALKSTSGKDKQTIIDALDQLMAGGSTAGAAGIDLAYNEAEKHFKKNGNNRIILATDGDFNVGAASAGDLEKLITQKRETGIFLSVLGFGMGNYKDHQMETLADKGNGNYAYIDNIQEARKVFIHEFGGTLHTVAKDVKIQIEFNPKFVQAYRLIGYENRMLAAEDFDNDKKDAGELGAGHSMTALYEIVPAGVKSKYISSALKLKYQDRVINSDDFMTLKMRYKNPKEDKSVKIEIVVSYKIEDWETLDNDFRFATAVAGFGMLLKDSDFKGQLAVNDIVSWAQAAKGQDSEGQRAECIQLMKLYGSLDNTESTGK